MGRKDRKMSEGRPSPRREGQKVAGARGSLWQADTDACEVKASSEKMCSKQLLACLSTHTPFHDHPIVYRPKLSVYQVLQLLRNTMGASITLYLNPPRDLTDLPLKAFYRFALPDVTPGVGRVWGRRDVARGVGQVWGRRDVTLGVGRMWGRCDVTPGVGQVWGKHFGKGAMVVSVHMHMSAP